jgi:hypothetical protein
MEEAVMKKRLEITDASRRNFIRGTAAIGVSSVVVAAVPTVAVSASSQPGEEQLTKDKGYRVTQHILDYYKTLVS